MTRLGSFLASKGIENYCFVDYQGGEIRSVAYYLATGQQNPPSSYNVSQADADAAYKTVYFPLGLRIFSVGEVLGTWDGSKQLESLSPPAGILIRALYPFGYGPQDGGLVAANPTLLDYSLFVNTSTTPPTFLLEPTPTNPQGIPIDNQSLILAKWKQLVAPTVHDAAVMGVFDGILSDYPLNNGGYALGGSAPAGYTYTGSGHNLVSYSRFVTTRMFTDVMTGGNHNKDGTPCLLYANFVSKTSAPAFSDMAVDVYNYHYDSLAKESYYRPSYRYYLLSNYFAIQQSIVAYMKSVQGNAMANYMVPDPTDPMQVPMAPVRNNGVVVPDPTPWFGTIVGNGGTGALLTDENTWIGSYLGRSGPLPDNLQWLFFCNCMPYAGNDGVFGMLENIGGYYLGTTYNPECIELLGITTPWAPGTGSGIWLHFGQLMNNMPYIGGYHGYENEPFKVLSISHHIANLYTYGFVNNIAHQWGIHEDQLPTMNLNSFDVIFVDDKDLNPPSNFWPTIAQWVQNGGHLVYSKDQGPMGFVQGSPLAQLLGVYNGGSRNPGSAVVNDSGHPILAPYGLGILPAYKIGNNGTARIAASSVTPIVSDSINGPAIWENAYGSGKVIFLGGSGISTADNWNNGPNCGYYHLVLNAMIYAANKGLPTPAVYFPSYSHSLPLLGQNGQGPIACMVYGSGSNKLVWLSNVDQTGPHSAGLLLSQAYFKFPASWALTNANGGAVSRGTGDIDLTNYQIPAHDWAPLYVTKPAPAVTSTVIKITTV